MKLPAGSSVFWRDDKKRYVLGYADPVKGRPQKVLPKELTSQKAAEAWAVEWLTTKGLRPAEALQQRRDGGLSVAACAAKWLTLRENDERVAPATLQANAGHLHNHLLPYRPTPAAPALGERPIASLDVPELRALVRHLRGKLAPQTCRNAVYTLTSLYADAMAEGWVRAEANILDHPGVKAELPELEDSEPIALSISTAQALLGAAVVPLERRARYVLAFSSGMRDGEIAGARFRDTELGGDLPVLRIEQAVAIVGARGKGGFARPKAPKTKKSRRTIPLHPAAAAALQEWIDMGWPLLVGRTPGPDDYLFPSLDGHAARPRSAQLLRDDLAAIGLPMELDGAPVEFKATRSSFASWLDEADVPQPVIKRLMGHAARDVTEKHYTARDIERLARAVATIPLVWAPLLGTLSNVVTGGTTESAKPLELLAPPRRIERPTNGLGSRRRSRRRSAGSAPKATKEAAGDAPAKGFYGSKGPRESGLGGARHQAAALPDGLRQVRQGLSQLRAMDAVHDRLLAEWDEEQGRGSGR